MTRNNSLDPLFVRSRLDGKKENLKRTLLSKLGLDRNYRKVFAIGFNKTATTSIHAIFGECGMTATHNVQWRGSRHPLVHWVYQGFSDGPPDDFRRLDRRFPRSRFVLNTRDLAPWLDSRLRHLAKQRAKGKTPDFTRFEDPKLDIADWVRRRNRHHAAVLDYFRDRPADLLVVNYIRDPDAAARIGRFAGNKNAVSRPHLFSVKTERPEGELKYRELIGEVLQSMDIPETEWDFDLLCPSLGDVAGLPWDSEQLSLLKP
ncbi:MAG: hypothetical protein ABIO40_12610 [Devosia sp.]